MDNVYSLVIGAALIAAGIVAFRESKRVRFVPLPLLGSPRVVSCSSSVWSMHSQE